MKDTANYIISLMCGTRFIRDGRPGISVSLKNQGFDTSGRAPVFTIMIIFLICVGGFVYYYRTIAVPPEHISAPAPSADALAREQWKEETRKELEAEPRSEIQKKAEADDEQKKEMDLPAGWVTITDPWARQVSRFRAAIAENGWLALPVRACLAGKRWEFTADSGWKGIISGGLWVYGDRVGLWQIEKNAAAENGPELGSWKEKDPVSWSSLESDREYPYIMPKALRPDGFFISASLPESINEIGIFMQDGTVVGWSFGEWLERGYMWKGLKGKELKERTWVSSFYNITFANGREEKFALASSMPKQNDGMNQLAAFIDGFRLQPKLTLEDTPIYLLPEEVVMTMRHIITSRTHRSNERKIITMLNSRVLKEIGDINLVMDVVAVIKSAYGYEAAIGEAEDSGLFILRKEGQSMPAFSKLHVELYQDWLQSLISAGSLNRGLQAFDSAQAYFPDDPAIHLSGVELEILAGNWDEAERLLYSRTYPPELQDRYRLLALRISEIKGEEDQIVIHFPRKSSRIIVTAVINGTSYQEFLVDTGASMVTIPSAAVESLGLKIVEGYHGGKRPVSTAGGTVMAHEVMIESIEINGWTEYDVRALVLDMPDQPGLGLLGLNYLSRFQADLQPDEGMLKLTPQ